MEVLYIFISKELNISKLKYEITFVLYSVHDVDLIYPMLREIGKLDTCHKR